MDEQLPQHPTAGLSAVEGRAKELIEAHTAELERDARLGFLKRYLEGDQDLPYCPRGARVEFKVIAEKSITNWLPLISDTFSKGLWVDGYRPGKSVQNAPAWEFWQANGLDARQTVAHRGALEYGAAYTLVLPGRPTPLIKPISPLKTYVRFEDFDDEWPYDALIRKGVDREGGRLFQLLEGDLIHDLRVPKDSDNPKLMGSMKHSLGVVPMVRFRERLDCEEARGIIRPLVNLQDRINEAVFNLLIALQYASFRQRWATGLDIPRDPDTNEPVEPFESAVDRLWVSPSPEAKFGDFAQTEVHGHLRTYESAVKTLAAIAQTPPQALMGDLVQLSAEALAAAESSTQRKTGEYETLFGESWEQAFRLASASRGDRKGASDTSAQVRWRDTEARSLAATVDALGKMAQMLAVPVEALWERIPGVTDQDVKAWKELLKKADSMQTLAEALTATAQVSGARQDFTDAAPPPAEVS